MTLRICDFKDVDISAFDAVVVGSGFAGAVTARELAERGGMRVLILEKRPHIGGNMYDEYDEAGILVHRYGPHIFHTNDQRVFNYVTCWRIGMAPTCPCRSTRTPWRSPSERRRRPISSRS